MNVTTLSHTASVILPLRDKHDLPMPHDTLRTVLAERFGGCTVTACRGAWVAENGRLDDEDVVRYSVSSSEIPHVEPIGAWLLCATLQDAVFIEIDGVASILSR